MKQFNNYGFCAIKSAELNDSFTSPKAAWEKVALVVFDSKSSQVKGCPKNTYLGLCEEGLVKSIPKGNYTKSIKNKEYAIKAVEILKKSPSAIFSAKELWEKLELGDKSHNSQMHVVLALWENELIVK